MLHLAVNMEASDSYQASTDNFVNQHGFRYIFNDYMKVNGTTISNGAVRLQFQPSNQRPVFAAINGVSNSPTHQQWELLANHGGYGAVDFSAEIAAWRAIIDSVQAPPPLLEQPVMISDDKISFTLSGRPGLGYRIQASPDLVNWSVVATVTNDASGLSRFTNQLQSPRQFYRAAGD